MDLKHEYLETCIRKKLFKEFEEWKKDDFHFLLSLLHYPSYCSLGLVLLTNLKNWINHGTGQFFYTIEQIEKVLDQFNFNFNDEQILESKNITLNIEKKEEIKEPKKINETFIPFIPDSSFDYNINIGFWVIIVIVYFIFKLVSFPRQQEPKPKPISTLFSKELINNLIQLIGGKYVSLM